MPKKLVITVELENPKYAGRMSADDLANLFTGIDGGQVDGSIVSAKFVDEPVVAEVADEGEVRAYTSVSNVGALRRFLAGIPDSAALESYSGSVESLVNFGLSYGESYDEYSRDAGSYVLTINNEN